MVTIAGRIIAITISATRWITSARTWTATAGFTDITLFALVTNHTGAFVVAPRARFFTAPALGASYTLFAFFTFTATAWGFFAVAVAAFAALAAVRILAYISVTSGFVATCATPVIAVFIVALTAAVLVTYYTLTFTIVLFTASTVTAR